MPDVRKIGDNDWPIGMGTDGELHSVTPPPGLTDDQISDWLDTHDEEDDRHEAV